MADGGSGVVVSATNAAGSAATTVTFNGFGMVTGSSAIQSISVTGSSGGTTFSRRVEITSGGVTRLCDPNIASTDTRGCIQ
jgi:type IV fimbrial biogenesis protein FimT